MGVSTPLHAIWAWSCRNFKLTLYIVETTCGQPPQALGNPKGQANYKHHPSINQIRKKCSYSFREAKKEEINILIKRLNPKKATGPDGIPLKIIKLSADVIDKHLTNIINTDLECSCFSENAKIPSLKSMYKKENRSDKIIIDKLTTFQRFTLYKW